LFDKDATGAEVDLLRQQFGHCKGTILDVGAGFGRHATPLRKAGVNVVALDRFRHLLDGHPRRGRRVVQADMRSLPFAASSFEGAYCLFNTFGYFGPDENTQVLKGIARVLRPGSRFVLQTPNRPIMAKLTRDFPPMRMLSAKTVLTETYSYNDATKCLVGRGHWQIGDKEQTWEFSLRLYTRGEVGKILKSAGFTIVEELGSLDPREPFSSRASSEMILICQRA
jgi:SAM-dependent methyltransferase